MKSKATGCGSISTAFSSIVLLCVSSVITKIIIIIIVIIIIITIIIIVIIIIKMTIIMIMIITIIIKGLIPTLAVVKSRLLNWLVRTGRYTVRRDKSPKATVTSFIVQIQVAGLAY